MLHDIAIYLTDSPGIDCTAPSRMSGTGPRPGHSRGPRHAPPRAGLRAPRGGGDQRRGHRPLQPAPAGTGHASVTLEEQIICYADKFFSKNGGGASREKSVAEIVASLRPYGADKVERFMGGWNCSVRHAAHRMRAMAKKVSAEMTAEQGMVTIHAMMIRKAMST